MTRDLVVAITLGQRDLQVLAIGPDGKLCRVSPDKGHVRALHEAWLGPAPARLILDGRDPREERGCEALLLDGRVGFSRPDFRLATAADLGQPAGGEAVFLAPGLLRRALSALANQPGRVHRILFFTTDREEGGRAAGEPVAAFHFLGGWLRGRQGIAADAVQEVVCLERGEELTQSDAAGSTWLSPTAAGRVDDALREAREGCAGATIRLHLSGGIPALSEAVQASALFRFPRVEYRSPSEDRGTTHEKPRFTSAEDLHGRRQTAGLVESHQFQAAAVVAERFAQPGPAGHWQKAIHAVARYFAGYMTDAFETAGRIPATQSGPKLARMITSEPPHAFHVAMRAEAALRVGDVLAGAALTSTFYDVALFDAVDQHLSKPGERCVDWIRRAIKPELFRPRAPEVERAIREAKRNPMAVQPEQAGTWLANLGVDIPRWHEWLLCRLVETAGRKPDLTTALDRLSSAFYRGNRPDRPADFRNRVTHSRPQQSEIEAMEASFENNQLWKRVGNRMWSFLHPDALASKVLDALGVPSPAALYDSLVAAVLHDIAAAPLHAGA
jgi:hypothetical protein